MPTVSGQLQLQDYDDELTNRGFDGIDATHRTRLINLAYTRIASKFPWLWEKTTVDLTMAPGTSYFTIVGATPDLPNFRTLDYIYVTTEGQRKRLDPIDDHDFYENWLARDLAAAVNRSEPTAYRIEDRRLYILPPPNASRTFTIHYRQRPGVLVNATDVPLTPQYLDEGILLAALSNAHKRVYELQMAAQMELDLGEWIDQMRTDEETQDWNKQ